MLLSTYDSWELLNEKLVSTLGLQQGDFTARAYTGLAPAIWEIVQGAAQFYSHKKSVAIITGNTPHITPALPYLYKDGFNVQTLSHPQDNKAFVEGLKKDTNFVILCEDHPVTGELYAVDEIDHLLNEKKIFCLRVSHANHLYRAVEIKPYTVRICGYHPRAAIALLGSKFKSPATVAPLQFWDPTHYISSIQTIKSAAEENKSAIENFESNLPNGFSVLSLGKSRCFDRSLIYCEDVAGEPLQMGIASKLKINLQKPGWENAVETTHLCRWGGVSTYKTWWENCPSEAVLRNLLILSSQVVGNPTLLKALSEVLSENKFLIE